MANHFFQPKVISSLQDYSLKTLKADLLAGLAVGIVAIPLAIAFAIASGASPKSGLITAIVAGFLTSLLGGSRVAIGGPTGAFVVIILGIIQQYGFGNLLICTMMAGGIMLALGVFRLGGFINYIPYPLISGFTSGIAVLIFSTQLKDFLGLPAGEAESGFLSSMYNVAANIGLAHTPTVVLAVVCFLAIFFWPKRMQRILPGPIVVLIIATVFCYLTNLPVATIGTRFGGLSGSLPSFQVPTFNLETFHFLLGPAVTIALLGSIESLLCAVVADGMIGDKHDPNQELMAQGIANIVTPFFGGLPATGAIARTATNIRNGGSTPVAGMVHAVVCLLVMLVAAPLASAVPLAALSAILMCVALNMGQWREFLKLKHYPKSDDVVFLLTFSLTVIFDLTVAVEIGMVTAALLFIKRMASQTDVEIRPMVLEPEEMDLAEPAHGTTNEILILRIYGELFFGAAQKLSTAMRYLAQKPKVIIIKMKYVFSLDASSLVILTDLVRAARRRGISVYISGLTRQPLGVIKKSGLYAEMGAESFFADQASAVAAACRWVDSCHEEEAAAQAMAEEEKAAEERPPDDEKVA
ncbi:STAS domain-containing protein [Deltaproteobacteria bacterium OttesenSCG-928-M10]|nr:STAS domain-containing protein [Deltaproteobacteria bacterium OttesenSCG-928-M10]